jgi:hypothetical protein
VSWLGVRLNDQARVARAVEIKPGLMASPWERGTCQNGRAFPARWTWRPGRGETIETGEPEGLCGCKKCQPTDED